MLVSEAAAAALSLMFMWLLSHRVDRVVDNVEKDT
jgi:hypothetical protein